MNEEGSESKSEQKPDNHWPGGETACDKNVSIKEGKLNEKNLTADTENDFGGLPDTGNFKKFMGCGG